jgi:ubiquinone/menaquinone biosynthesis C-methylase UbiE
MSESAGKKTLVYRPEIFDAHDLASAMDIILTPETGTTTQERWEYETPYLADEIARALELNADACVLDYGCGIGRLAKALIERHNCFVLGVDISSKMRELAHGYVSSDRFAVCAPEMLDRMIVQGLRVTHVYACWVIQHCATPAADLGRIDAALARNGRAYVLNNLRRCVPTDRGWVDDGISVEALLTAKFDLIEKNALPEVITTPEIAQGSFTMTLRKRD